MRALRLRSVGALHPYGDIVIVSGPSVRGLDPSLYREKLECFKQAIALNTLAWDNIIGFRSYSVGLRDRSND